MSHTRAENERMTEAPWPLQWYVTITWTMNINKPDSQLVQKKSRNVYGINPYENYLQFINSTSPPLHFYSKASSLLSWDLLTNKNV